MTLRSFAPLALAAAGLPALATAQPRPAPGADTLRVPGLRAPVAVTRDSNGIAHIRAASEHDLFFAQGYNAARDRGFQLELWRRQATGTLAEALGPAGWRATGRRGCSPTAATRSATWPTTTRGAARSCARSWTA
jgi:penicillin amidase